MAIPTKARPSIPLEGENLKTSHWEDARHWMSIYADLLEFKRGILDRVKRDLAGLQPLARKAAAVDVQIIEDQMQGYQARLDLWYRRIWDLHGLSLDPQGRMIGIRAGKWCSRCESSNSCSSHLTIPTATSAPARS